MKSLEWHLGWWDVSGEQISFQVWYHLQEAAPGRREVGVDWHALPPDTRRRLRHLIDWCLAQFPDPVSYQLFGKTIQATLALDVVHFPVFGETEVESNTLSASTFEWHPDRKVYGPNMRWAEGELPPEVQELARSFDDAAWDLTKQKLIADFGENAPALPAAYPPMVYIAYRDDRPESKDAARRLNQYFLSKRIRTFFAPWSVGWGASLFDRMRRDMAIADAAVLCYTSNFLAGETARGEGSIPDAGSSHPT